jgi:hypothetical protein
MRPVIRLRHLGAALAIVAAACSQQGSPLGPGSNRAPVIRRVTLTPSTIPRGGTATVEVEASDPEGGALFYRYAAEAGQVTPDSTEPWRAVYVNTGSSATSDHLTATVVDSRDAATSLTVSVTLQDNRAPELRLPDSDPCHPTCRGGFDDCHPVCALNFLARASDPDGDPLTYSWSGCVDDSNAARGTCHIATPGRFSATVLVRDTRGATAVATASGDGTNRAPLVAGGGTVHATAARLNIQPSDPDGDPLRCGWSGTCQCTGDVQSFNQSCGLPAGLATCSELASCFDPFGGHGEARFDMVRP